MAKSSRRIKRSAGKAFSSADAENDPVSKKCKRIHGAAEDDDEVAEYDLIRQRNIEMRERLFNELKISEGLNSLIPPKGKQSKPSNRGLAAVKKPAENKVVVPERKSLRLQKIDAETGLQLPEKEPTKYVVRSFEDRARLPLEELSIKDVAEWRESEDLDRLVEEKTSYLKSLTSSQDFDSKAKSSFDGPLGEDLKKLKITPERVCKVTPNRIFSMSVHPMTSSVLVAAGDKWGAIGLWNVNDTTSETHGVQVFYPHSRPINCLSFSPYDSNKLVSTSYDGSVRCFDLDEQSFSLIYGNDDDGDVYTGSHCHVDAHTYLVSFGRTGIVGLVDTRVSTSTRVRDYQVYERVSARMASLHPVKRHLFIAPNSKGECGIFDLRSKTKAMKPVISLLGHTKSLSSAAFSCVTGDDVVTVCWDHKVRIYDIRKGDKIPAKKQISHNNNTGQWLTTFKAEFHPRRDDVFFVGSMAYPRQMDVYDISGNHFPIRGEDLTSVCSVVKPHPTVNVVVGGNSSGRVFAFM